MEADAGNEAVPLLTQGDVSKTKGALIASRRWITVEPVVTAISIVLGLLLSVQTQYFRHYFAAYYNRTGATNSTHCQPGGNYSGGMQDSVDEKIQESVSSWVTYINICMAIGCVPVAFILGCYSDHIGRKVPMTCPVIGLLASSVISLVAIQYELPLYVFLISALVLGLGGGFMLCIAMCLAYVADFTTEKNRLFHFVVLEILLFVMVGVPQVAVGYVIKSLGGYATPYAIAIVILLVALLYIWFPRCLPETVWIDLNRSKTPIRSALKETCQIMRVTEGRRHIKMALYLFVFFAMVGFGVSSLQISLVYSMGEPFCLDPSQTGMYLFTLLLVSGIGCMVGGALLPLCLGAFGLMYCSFISTQLGFLVTALAVDTGTLYFAAAVGSLRLLAAPVCRSRTSEMVQPSEQGTLFSMIGVTSNLAELVFPVFLQSVYTLTVETNSQIVFYLAAGLVCVPLVGTMVLQYISRGSPPTVHVEASVQGSKVE